MDRLLDIILDRLMMDRLLDIILDRLLLERLMKKLQLNLRLRHLPHCLLDITPQPLGALHTDEDVQVVAGLLQGDDRCNDAWLGLTNRVTGTWGWKDSSPNMDTCWWNPWDDGHPTGQDKCACMTPGGDGQPPRWRSTGCNELMCYVCAIKKRDITEQLVEDDDNCNGTAACKLNSAGTFECQQQDAAVCDSNPCQNGGQCTVTQHGYHCECLRAGYHGANCHLVDSQCAPNPCLNGGRCQADGATSHQCFCEPGFEGLHCEHGVDNCVNHPCQNGATCQNLVNAFKCLCPRGYSGVNCEQNVDECLEHDKKGDYACNGADSYCRDTAGSYLCECSYGYKTTDSGSSECTVIEEVTACDNSTCVHGECSSDTSSSGCVCDDGYSGEICSTDINECNGANECSGGQWCQNSLGSYSCFCKTGFLLNQTTNSCYAHSKCSDPVATCGQHSTCYEVYTEDEYAAKEIECGCEAGYEHHGHSTVCTNVNDCPLEIPCVHGVCEDDATTINAYSCVCGEGWEGQFCDTEPDCETFSHVESGPLDTFGPGQLVETRLGITCHSPTFVEVCLVDNDNNQVIVPFKFRVSFEASHHQQRKQGKRHVPASASQSVSDPHRHPHPEVVATQYVVSSEVNGVTVSREVRNITGQQSVGTFGDTVVAKVALFAHRELVLQLGSTLPQFSFQIPAEINMADLQRSRLRVDGGGLQFLSVVVEVNQNIITAPNECDSSSDNSEVCENNGTCVDGVNSFTCQCMPDYTGATCSLRVTTMGANVTNATEEVLDDSMQDDFLGGSSTTSPHFTLLLASLLLIALRHL